MIRGHEQTFLLLLFFPKKTYTEPMDTRKNAQYHQHSGKCIKTVMRNHLTFVGKSIITKTISKCWEGCGEKETLVHSWRACKLGQPQWKIVWRFLKNVKTEQLSIQFSSVIQSCLTLCDPMDCSTPDLPVHHQLPEFTQTHVH